MSNTLYIVNGSDYPRHIGDLLLAYPEYQEGSELPDEWEVVNKVAPPDADDEFYYVEGTPELTASGWVQTWVKLSVSNIEIRPRDDRGS